MTSEEIKAIENQAVSAAKDYAESRGFIKAGTFSGLDHAKVITHVCIELVGSWGNPAEPSEAEITAMVISMAAIENSSALGKKLGITGTTKTYSL